MQYHRRILVKLGGNALSGEGALNGIALQLAELIEAGFQPVLVHGGGPEISAEMERRGMKVRKAAGQRVTDEAALAVVIEVLTGINSPSGRGAARPGGCEGDRPRRCRVRGVVRPQATGDDHRERRGEEGRPWIGRQRDRGPGRVSWRRCSPGETVPVISPIGADSEGRRYNVNADTMAAFVARTIGAEEMVLLTDVPGILRGGEGTKEVIATITAPQIEALVAEGVITGGMIPKVEACRDALMCGMTSVLMLNGKEERSLVRRLLGAEKIGTTITK